MELEKIIVDSDEKLVFSLKNGNLQNVLSGEGIKRETAIVTDKRLYYSNKKGILNIVSRDEKVDLQDITGTKVTEANPIFLLIIGVLLSLIMVVFRSLVFGHGMRIDYAGLLVGSIVLVVCLILYFAFHKKYLTIEYAGGKIQFSLIGYKKENIIGFQNAIYTEKEKLNKKAGNFAKTEE